MRPTLSSVSNLLSRGAVPSYLLELLLICFRLYLSFSHVLHISSHLLYVFAFVLAALNPSRSPCKRSVRGSAISWSPTLKAG